MALTQQEKEIVRAGAELGKTKQEIYDALEKHRSGFVPELPVQGPVQPEKEPEKFARLKDAPSDIKEGFQNVIQRADERAARVVEGEREGQSGIGTIAQLGAGVPGTMADLIGEGVITGAKLFATPEQEEQISQKVSQKAEELIEKPAVQKTVDVASNAWNTLEQSNPEAARTLRAFAGPAELALDVVSFNVFNTAWRTLSKQLKKTDDFIKKSDELIQKNPTQPIPEQGPTPTLPSGVSALEEPVQLTLKEKWVGVRPDIKQRISGKHDLLADYFTVAHVRNGDIPAYDKAGRLIQADTQPTPLGYGAQTVRQTYDDISDILFNEGTEIGSTRRKLATTMMDVDQVRNVEDAFRQQLDKLDLEVRAGQIQQKPGTIKKVGADRDLVVMQELWSDLQIFKQSPTLKNAIDFRSAMDAKINFGRAARDVSGSVDPLARQVRKVTADEAAKVVGKDEAARLKRYSDLMDEYKELERYVNRNAGEEYLLRLLLSGRGREAAELVDAIKRETGVDLYDHATMATLATDLIGNINQKNLFRQEVSRAGLDASRALSGDPQGILNILSDKATDKIFDEESIFLRAAGAPQDFKLPEQVFPVVGTGAAAYFITDEDGNEYLSPEFGALIGAMSPGARSRAAREAYDQINKNIKRLRDSGVKNSDPRIKRLLQDRKTAELEINKSIKDGAK